MILLRLRKLIRRVVSVRTYPFEIVCTDVDKYFEKVGYPKPSDANRVLLEYTDANTKLRWIIYIKK